MPVASIVIPTRDRLHYLDVTLDSVLPQAEAAGAEVVVVDDSPSASALARAESRGARAVASGGRGLNAARNAGISAAQSDLIILIDDDVETPDGWLAGMLAGAQTSPDHDVFGGPIRARLEGGGPRACGRESAPITTLDRGSSDRDVNLVWGANMAIRQRAIDRVGSFDESLQGRGDEEEWEARYAEQGGKIRYLAAAGLVHRRTSEDARLRPLTVAAYHLGRTARRNDVRKRTAPSLAAEVRVLAGCVWHVGRRRCAVGIVLAGHSWGRLREALTSGSR
jgi:glycosyltransferase involved in cell wall biosynthesis